MELLRRIQTELVSDGGEGLLFDPCDLTRELLTEIAQVRDVNRDTGLFHLDEHVDERKLHVAIQTLEVQPHELVRELFAEPSRRDSAGARAHESLVERRRPIRVLPIGHRQDGHFQLQPLRREVLQSVIATAGVHEIARDHRVHRKTGDVRPGAAQRAAGRLRVVRGLGNALVPQYRGDRAWDTVGCRHVPRPLARGEAEADEQRVTT